MCRISLQSFIRLVCSVGVMRLVSFKRSRSLQGKKCSKTIVFSHFYYSKGLSPTDSWPVFGFGTFFQGDCCFHKKFFFADGVLCFGEVGSY